MNDHISGLVLADRVSDMRPMFDQWLRLYEQSNAVFPQTRELWYVERGLTALLVASAWNRELPAVGEVKSKRVRESGTGYGHIDAIIQLVGGLTAVEAKTHWFDDIGAFETVLGQLRAAESDARSIDPAFVGRRLALCFAVLQKGGLELQGLLSKAIDRAKSEQLDVLAWILDTSSPASVQYPGCLLLGRLV